MESDKQGEPVTLAPREQANPVISILKKIGLRSLAWVGVYLLGYFDFSVAWMITPLLLSVVRDHWKKEKRNKLAAAREAALSNEQAMIEARMNSDDLPSWVFFPDKERAEWVNNIMKQLWPYVNEYVRDLLFTTVEPAVESALKGFKLSPFKFDRDRVFLGQVPPRITGIKVYDTNTSRKEIILDVDLVFASDLEIVFKIKGISAKVSDFGLRGMARIVLKPLISQIPLIGGVQVYFLKPPEIDYNLGGVAGALEIPGLSRIVERIIIDQIKNFVVLPNKFSLSLVDAIPKKTLKCPDSAGVLRVKLLRAANLVDKDGLGSGVSDPYVLMTVGAHTHKVPTKRDTCDPVWERDNVFDFPIEVVQGQELLLEFYDDDDRKDDEFMGRAKIQTSVVAERGHVEGCWIELRDTEHGKVMVDLSWLPVTGDREVIRAASRASGAEDNTKGLVHIYVDSVKGLTNPKDPSYKPSARVRLSLNQSVQQSWPSYNTSDPVIEQGFVCLVRAPHFDEIRVEVVDFERKDEVLGYTSIRVSSLIDQPGMEWSLQPWILRGARGDAQIVMSASLRGLLPPQMSPTKKTRPSQSPSAAPEGRRDSLNPGQFDEARLVSGHIRLNLHRAEHLEKSDVTGKSDPYVVLSCQGRKYQTKVCRKTLDPVWEEEFWLDISAEMDPMINVQVYDKDKLGKDETNGRLSIDARRICQAGGLTKIWDSLQDCKSGRLLWSAEFVEEADRQDDLTAETVMEKREEEVNTITEENDVQEMVLNPDTSLDDISNKEDLLLHPDDNNKEDITKSLEEALKESDAVNNEDQSEPVIEVVQESQQLGFLGSMKPGFLRITVHRAEDLVAKDFGGKSDPYVVIRYDGQKSKSKQVKKELNPEFEFTTGYVVEEDGSNDLMIELKDHDDLGRNESLGYCRLDLRDIVTDGQNILKKWISLEGVEHGRVLVSVDLQGEGYNDGHEVPERGEDDMKKIDEPEEETQLRQRKPVDHGQVRLNILYDENKEELKLFLHEAINLPGGHLADLPDPYCKVYLMPGKKKKKKSEVIKDDVNPKFNEEFDFSIDMKDMKDGEMYLKLIIVDKKGVFTKSPILGAMQIHLDNPGLKNGIAGWFPLEQVDEESD